MAIRQLSLTHFRNIEQSTLDFDPKLNLVCGPNGSGKTSLLEAIYILCQAQSFRTHQLKQCIQHGQPEFVLFGKFDGYQAGISKQSQKLEIHINGEPVRRRSELVRQTPISIVNPDTFELIYGPPQRRRRFVDWCLFHVEHDYADCWVAFQHALKQRNRLLKTRRDYRLLDYWDRYLCEPSLKINRMRRQYMDELLKLISSEFGDLLDGIPVELDYIPGWPAGKALDEALKNDRERDRRAGFTHSGIHRDDIRFTSEQRAAGDVLSRGQGKRFCLALMLGALKLVARYSDKQIIFLIDDLHSELDNKSQALVYRQLGSLDLQLFVSTIETTVPLPLQAKEIKMFHVEHGTIIPRNFS